MTPQEITLFIYNLALIPVVFFSLLFLILSALNLFVDNTKQKDKKTKNYYPFVTVQIPSFNDPVAVRCIKACMKLNYPKDKYEIMIVDDSTNKETQRILKKFETENKGFIKYVHRENREGYKPGALKDAMHLVKGEIIAIFDADFIPKKDFLKIIVEPFQNPKVAIVQGRQGFINTEKNLITKFAAYLLMIHHTILMPINHKFNSVFFCGTGGAIRKKAIDDVGGWNADSITEDSDLSVKILSKGYKNVYVKFETPSEVPETIEAFLKQQQRWTFGNIRVFIDNAKQIIFSKKFKFGQKFMMTFVTLGPGIAPIILLMTLAGFAGWFFGEPQLFGVQQLMEFTAKFFITAGFLLMAYITLYKQRSLKHFPSLVLATFSISIVLAMANSVAVYKALFQKNKHLYKDKKNSWISTPKTGNAKFLK
ncbi:glycosyltransferase [Candidatus Woesearchaeota archaeon]|nr:glycosyltransferase [Candidatus Woesearchaeota archaeon]MCF7901425.1 glycosyltransferase [Candidatus Woesearchaeota archaeon]MCF8012962.1 glycosyltransferase [Candidatus Woesearchaeota archaeon]